MWDSIEKFAHFHHRLLRVAVVCKEFPFDTVRPLFEERNYSPFGKPFELVEGNMLEFLQQEVLFASFWLLFSYFFVSTSEESYEVVLLHVD